MWEDAAYHRRGEGHRQGGKKCGQVATKAMIGFPRNSAAVKAHGGRRGGVRKAHLGSVCVALPPTLGCRACLPGATWNFT
eukprot:296351-Chlamydomonas_euryale.AAC.1